MSCISATTATAACTRSASSSSAASAAASLTGSAKGHSRLNAGRKTPSRLRHNSCLCPCHHGLHGGLAQSACDIPVRKAVRNMAQTPGRNSQRAPLLPCSSAWHAALQVRERGREEDSACLVLCLSPSGGGREARRGGREQANKHALQAHLEKTLQLDQASVPSRATAACLAAQQAGGTPGRPARGGRPRGAGCGRACGGG